MNPFQWLFEVYQSFWLYAGKAWDITPWWALVGALILFLAIGEALWGDPETNAYYAAQFRAQSERDAAAISQMRPDPTSPFPQPPEGPGWFGNKQEYANQTQRYVDFYTKPPHQYPEMINRR
jgi:hypothetical protein